MSSKNDFGVVYALRRRSFSNYTAISFSTMVCASAMNKAMLFNVFSVISISTSAYCLGFSLSRLIRKFLATDLRAS